MRKNVIYIFVIIIIVIVGIIIGTSFSNKEKMYDCKIIVDEVEYIELWGIGETEVIKDTKEIERLINLYNSISDIKETREVGGITAESGISIFLKSKGYVSIQNEGYPFLISVKDKDGKVANYMGKQKVIKEMLDSLSKSE